VQRINRTLGFTLVVALAASLAAACSENGPTQVQEDSPLAGLVRGNGTDSVGTPPPPPPPTNPTPGYVRGTVLAPSIGAPPGTDTLATATRIVGARVTAYPRIRSTTDTLGVGPVAAQVLTNERGEFQLPTLPGGEYIITFNPPPSQNATYGGVWAVSTIHQNSHVHPWWIILWKK
jgi:hypothetical protein